MKMVVLMFLEDDEPVVTRMLERLAIVSFSSLELEGHGAGAPGWYGEVAPYQSRMIFVVLPEPRARELLRAVREVRGVADPEHPIHAVQMAVEETADCCEVPGDREPS